MKSSLSFASARIMYIVALALAASTLSFAASGAWSPTGTMLSARDGHTATILTNEKFWPPEEPTTASLSPQPNFTTLRPGLGLPPEA